MKKSIITALLALVCITEKGGGLFENYDEYLSFMLNSLVVLLENSIFVNWKNKYVRLWLLFRQYAPTVREDGKHLEETKVRSLHSIWTKDE